MLRLFNTKNQFLRRIIPRLRTIGELVREKNEAVERAEKSEYMAWKAVEGQLKALREENRRLRDQNLELASSARGRLSNPDFLLLLFLLLF